MECTALIDKIITKICDYDYVSFDIFDTLLKRDVPCPHTIFELVENLMESKLGIRIDDFHTKRIEAERVARKIHAGEEVTLCEIYETANDTTIQMYADKLMEFEEKIEYEASIVNYPIYQVYNWCIENNKHVIIISDMYLREDFIVTMLYKSGYKNYEMLFLSNTWKKRKAENGSLFEVACQELRIQAKQLIHIGDSKISDGTMAERIGCKSIVIPRVLGSTTFFKRENIFHKLNMHYKLLKSFCENRSFADKGYFYSFGYEAFGPFLAGYAKWLYNEIKKENIKQLYFFSRDGLIIKKVFNELYVKDTSLKTSYLLVSRRSLRVPHIWLKPDYLDVIKGFPEASLLSIITFFDTLGLDFKDYEAICERLGIDKQYTYKKSELEQNKKLENLYNEIKLDVINNSKKEFAALQKYLREQQLDKKVAVIDIGWHGTMQKFLMEILESSGIDTTLFGYYVGLAVGARKNSEEMQINFKGYLFDLNISPEERDLRSPFVGLFETLFLAQEGSTKRYFIDASGKVQVELYDNEYETEEENLTEDAENVMRIQEGALQFVKDYKNSLISELELGPEILFHNVYEIGMHPSKTDLSKFGDIEFRDGEILKLAAPKTFVSYCWNPKALIRDFYNSRWKIGFMKRLLKISLPYEKIYWALKKTQK